MKRFLLSILCCLLAVVSGYAEEKEATLTFDNTSKRTTYTGAQQVWEENGITLTNNKAASTTNVGDYASPARFYKSSEIIVNAPGNITNIVFNCSSSSYATALKNSIKEGAVTASGSAVTVTGISTSETFTISSLTGGQVRMNSLTVTYEVTGSGSEVSKPATPTLTDGGNFVGSMEVEISCATEGAEIYYTTDGTEPTEDSNAYTEAFEITKTTTIKAIAVNEAGASNVATAEYTRVAATPEIVFDGEGTFKESIEVTIKPADGTTAYYTLNGMTPNKSSEECPEVLTLKADATLQVIAYDVDGYASLVVKQAFKLTSSGASGSGSSSGTATLVESVGDLEVGDNVVIVATDTDAALSTEQKSNNRGHIGITKSNDKSVVTLNDNVQILTLEKGTVDGTFAFNTGSGYLYAASSNNNYLRTQTTNNANGSWSIEINEGIAKLEAQGTNTRNCMQYNKASNLFACYSSFSQQAISLYKVDISTVEDYVLNVSAAGWATLYLGYNTVIPEGVTCYAVSSVGDGKVTLTEIEGNNLPANKGVIVKAKEGQYTFEATEDNPTAEVESLLLGTTKNEYIDKEAYVLGIVDGEVGLYKAQMNGGVFLNNANKAYLPASALKNAQGASSLKFNFGATTDISGVATQLKSEVIYDLYGRKVNSATAPGIYIINGKKVMVK